MSSKLLLPALVVSVLFNVFFLAGYVKARRAAGEQTGTVTDVLSDELGLDAQQVARFSELRRGGREDTRLYDDSLALVRQEMIDALEGDEPEVDQLPELIERETELHRDLRLLQAGRLAEFVGALNPEQRHRLRGRLDRGAGRHRMHREMIRRFDIDGDGVLGPQERATAREHLQRQRTERERGMRGMRGMRDGRGPHGPRGDGLRQELRRRFDADGDGRLSAEEAAALREWMRAGGG